MNLLRNCIILASSAIFAAGACSSGPKANTNTAPGTVGSSNSDANTEKTNVEELGMLVSVPYETEDIVWKDLAAQKKLIAVLRFSSADGAKLVAEASAVHPPVAVSIQCETWFPDELIAQSDLSGDDTLKATAYAANAFLQPPFNEGRISRVEGTDYFVLEVSAK
jgi:hypothetical protein